MQSKIQFILNRELIEVNINPATVLLDYVRSLRLTGTKEGCKEGDCGACTVLAGELSEGKVNYKSVNSCLIPVQNISGKHIVTIEGLNSDEKNLNPIQQAFLDEGASQCGFCTPGFIVSLTGYLLNEGKLKNNNVLDSLDGNICRCTGHSSIIRAAERIRSKFKNEIISSKGDAYEYLTENKIIPGYFLSVKKMLEGISNENMNSGLQNSVKKYFIGGGTDLFVQRPEEMLFTDAQFLDPEKNLKGIKADNGYCQIGCSVTVTDLLESETINNIFPQIYNFAELFGSTPIRNSATVGGNINNASPIGDMTAFFLALNSNVILSDGSIKREIPLNEFYTSYKKTARKPEEYMEGINFKIPDGNYFFNFEKVSKRTYLDIASVNSAILINVENEVITDVNISAGGVAATPLFLFKTCQFLKGKILNAGNIKEAISISQNEISPISDARGSADYKKLLLIRLLYAHFVTLFPEIINAEQTV
ncbi:MAG: FAD binding domain-containing protein [Ignavibacteria bacterium]|nr:FAD binding domain-containing protein [Ignavibacteria bacterium]